MTDNGPTGQAHLTPEQTQRLLDRYQEGTASVDAVPESEELATVRKRLITGAQLQTKTFPPTVKYIDGFILEGLGILGGKPKLGKSWWALSAAVTIAAGGVAFGDPNREV